MLSWLYHHIPRRLRPRNLGYYSLALLAGDREGERQGEQQDEHEYADKECRSPDDDGVSVDGTLVGDSPIESGLLAELDEKSWTRQPSRRERLGMALRKMDFLLPSFMVGDDKPAGRVHPSAWLDGLRGVAAFLVVWHHSSLLFFSWDIHNGYHSTDEPKHDRWIQLPLLRVLIAGSPQVKIFFAISGYALSYKPLKLARQGRYKEWASALGSSVFRRHPRLFMPAVLMTAMSALAAYNRLFGGNMEESNWNEGAALKTRSPPLEKTAYNQTMSWFGSVLAVTDPFSTNGRRGATPYDMNLWTLPVEFDCSLVVFLCLAAFSHLRPVARLMLNMLACCFTLWYTYWPQFLFLSGMFICDLHFQLERREASLLPESGADVEKPSSPSLAARLWGCVCGRAKGAAARIPVKRHLVAVSSSVRRAVPSYMTTVPPALSSLSVPPVVYASYATASTSASAVRARLPGLPPQITRLHPMRLFSLLWWLVRSISLWHILSVASAVAALWLLSFPELNRGGRKSPGYITLVEWIPTNYARDEEGHWWLSIGAVMLIFTVDRAVFLQRPFTTAFAQYLGKISYSLYLVHGPILFSLGWHMGRSCTSISGRETETDYAKGVAFAYALLWPVLIWSADLVWRLVDNKAVEFGKWAYDKLTRTDDP